MVKGPTPKESKIFFLPLPNFEKYLNIGIEVELLIVEIKLLKSIETLFSSRVF